MRKWFYGISFFLLALVGLIGYWHHIVWWWYLVLIPVVFVGFRNIR